MKRRILVEIETDETGEYCNNQCELFHRIVHGANCNLTEVDNALIYDWDYHRKNECEQGTCYKRCDACKEAEMPLDFDYDVTTAELRPSIALRT